jgi:hypothetical protein
MVFFAFFRKAGAPEQHLEYMCPALRHIYASLLALSGPGTTNSYTYVHRLINL